MVKKQHIALISHSHVEIMRAQRVGEGIKLKRNKEINKIKDHREKIICNHTQTMKLLPFSQSLTKRILETARF